MKKNILNLILLTAMACIFTGCAGLTGVTNWKENTFVSPLDRDATIKIATQAIERLGTVQFTDTATGTVSGTCNQQVDAAVTAYDENGKTMVIVKSKLNVGENSMVIETGDRQNCINSIVEQMKSLAVQFGTIDDTNSGGDGNIGSPPSPDGMSDMASGSTTVSSALSEPMVVPANGSGAAVPLEIYPPGFDLSGYNILDPATGESVSGSGYTIRATSEARPLDGGASPMDSSEDAGGPATGFYRVVQNGVRIEDASMFGLTNDVLSNTVNIAFEAGNAANDGTGTNVLGNIECAALLIDGSKYPGDGGVLGSPTNTVWQFDMDTAYLQNGTHTLQVAVTWINPDNSDGNNVNITQYSDPVTIDVTNLISYPNWEPEVGEAGISAYFLQTVYTNVPWSIAIYDVNNDLVQTLTNVTTDGTIEAYWNMVDMYGNTRTNAVLDPEFSSIVTVYDAPITKSTPKKIQRPRNWPSQGIWVVAYQDFFKFEYSDNNNMQSSINSYANTTAEYGGYYLYYPQPGQTNDIGQTYPMRYQKVNHPDTNITSTALFLDDQLLRKFLDNTNSRNFFYDGHADEHGIGNDLDSTLLKATIQQRYRFVMLDGCSTANGDLDSAFGIHGPGTFSLTYYENTGIRPAAFCGYNIDVTYSTGGPVTVGGVTYDDTMPDDVPYFIDNFLFYWDADLEGETLTQAISDAGNNLPDPGGPDGREYHWQIYGYNQMRINDYNYGTDTW